MLVTETRMFVTEILDEESQLWRDKCSTLRVPSGWVASGDVVSIQLTIVLFSIADTFSACRVWFRNQSFSTGFLLRKIQGIAIPVGKVLGISLLYSVCNHWYLSVHRMDFKFLELSSSSVRQGCALVWFSHQVGHFCKSSHLQQFVAISCWNHYFFPYS